MGYLDNDGLSYLWGKIKAALSSKQNKVEANGLLKGDGEGGVTAAVPGTDYLAESDVVICKISYNYSGSGATYLPDMTNTEIDAAYRAGKLVLVRYLGAFCSIARVEVVTGLPADPMRYTFVGFAVSNSGVERYEIVITPSDEITIKSTHDELAVCYLTYSSTDKTYTSSMTAEEIETARLRGKTVIVKYGFIVMNMATRTVASGETTPSFTFTGLRDLSVPWRAEIHADGTAVVYSLSLQSRSNLANNFGSPNTYQYPSTSAVWNAIPHAETKTDEQTQAVGMDADGKLWTKPAEDELPEVTEDDDGKFLRVVSGAWAAASISDANGVSF